MEGDPDFIVSIGNSNPQSTQRVKPSAHDSCFAAGLPGGSCDSNRDGSKD